MTNYVHPPQAEEDIASLYIEALELCDRLIEARIPTDLVIRHSEVIDRKRFLRRTVRMTHHPPQDAWDIPNLPDVDLDSLALAEDGQIYIYYSRLAVWVEHRVVMADVTPLEAFHLHRFITVQEVRDRLERFAEQKL